LPALVSFDLERSYNWSSTPVEVIVHASANRVPTRVVVRAVQAKTQIVLIQPVVVVGAAT